MDILILIASGIISSLSSILATIIILNKKESDTSHSPSSTVLQVNDAKIIEVLQQIKENNIIVMNTLNAINNSISHISLMQADVRQITDLTGKNSIISNTVLQDINKRVSVQEQILHQLFMRINNGNVQSEMITTFSTPDGKITANTMEELISKIRDANKLGSSNNQKIETESDIEQIFRKQTDFVDDDEEEDIEELDENDEDYPDGIGL